MTVKVALDVMGGDNYPHAQINGAVDAVNEKVGLEVYLIGDENIIKRALDDKNYSEDRLHVVHTAEKIDDEEQPTKAIRSKSDASLPLSMKFVKEGKADAVVSAGNTGAFMAGGLMLLGRLQGISRPALAPKIPNFHHKGVLLLDVGATMDVKPGNLFDFAMMGNIYAENVLKRTDPSIGLINVGGEVGKGTKLTREAYDVLDNSNLNFAGNLEARDLFDTPCDVAVCDGFLGNILLKFAEGMGGGMLTRMKEEFTRNSRNKLGAYLLKPSLENLKKELDYTEYGGAPFLGINGLCIKCHGSSNSKAIKHALTMQVYPFIKEDVISSFLEEVEKGRFFQDAK